MNHIQLQPSSQSAIFRCFFPQICATLRIERGEGRSVTEELDLKGNQDVYSSLMTSIHAINSLQLSGCQATRDVTRETFELWSGGVLQCYTRLQLKRKGVR